jgi:hypothetical protein
VGIDALAAIGVDGANHIVIGCATLDSGVSVCETADERGINLAVFSFGGGFAIHVVARDACGAGLPRKGDCVRFAGGRER